MGIRRGLAGPTEPLPAEDARPAGRDWGSLASVTHRTDALGLGTRPPGSHAR
jgi:hypothetical protein